LQSWLFFINVIFWFTLFAFLVNSYNIIQLLLISEACWVIIYCYTTIASGFTDDLTLLTITFFILGLAGLEFSIGFILIIVLNFFFKSNDNIDFKKKPDIRFEKQFNQNIKRYTNLF
jgi:NADH:ubiquinone oxidoreductase subunit K